MLHLKEMYEDDITLKILLSINMWFIIFLMKLISLNHICESVSVKARKTKNVVNRLTNIVGFAEVREEISQFVLQILLQPLKFNGLGLFYFGYDFIRKRFRICMKKLAAVDDTLEELGTPKIYQKIHMWSKRIVIGWLVYSLVVNFCDTKWWLDRKKITSWGFIVPHIYNHSLHVNTLVDLVFITFMWYIGTRFDKVQEHMQCLLVKEKRGLRNTWKKFSITCSYRYTLYADSYKQILWSST
ncbi:uncharacterized protein LOC143907079 isoform X1 [Temnothorax americanus]|uniref:uncharacterized protein LOC143907079 isoform X1 n=1 Tax=Temnothorax americanus TaxID=1964332 RepID=UPI004068F307